MGLGKTSITLTAIFDLLFDSFEVHRVLVIAPLRVARDTWTAEVDKWDHLQSLICSVAVGTETERKAALMRQADIYIINRENVQWLVEESGIPFTFDMIVIDELSSFKNHNTKRFKSLLKVRPKVSRIVGLTGTPASNGLMDLWAEFRILDMGQRLGRFITKYRTDYFMPDKRKWNAGAVRSILTNEKYKGDALLQKSYTVDFLTKKKKTNEGEIPQYYVEGNHEAIISPDVFEQVQRELERRKQGKGRHSGVHLFSGKIKCGQCGEWYGSKVWHSNSKYRRVIWQCNHKFDGDEKCATPHLTEEDIKTMFVSAVNQLISQKDAIIMVLTASLDTAFDLTALKAEQAELESEMTVVSDLIQKCIYENAHVALDQVEYQKRYDGLTARFDAAKARYESLDETIRSKQSRRATIEDFLATLKKANLVDTFDTALWCGLVDFATVYSKDDVRFTFKNGQEIKA